MGGVQDVWHGREPLPDDILDRVTELDRVFDRHGVQLGYLFGSLAKGQQGNDVDLAVLSGQPASRGLRNDLREILATERVHLVDLGSSTGFLQQEVVTSGKAVYRVDEATQVRYEETVGQGSHTGEVAPEPKPFATAPAKHALWQRWNALNCQVEQLWPHREITTEVIASSTELRWEIERGLLVALTLVANLLEQLRATPTDDAETDAGPRLFSRDLCRELRNLQRTRERLTGDGEPVPTKELAGRCCHALRWLPLFLRETYDWLAEGAGIEGQYAA